MAPEEHDHSQNSAAAHARVTPEELAQAVARIEARQAEQARREAATIPIGQAVEELGLGIAPEDILAQVQEQREQEAQRMAARLADALPPASAAAPAVAPHAMPADQSVGKAEVANCPACGRKLLTRTSALCNWCGARIDNPDYQAQAEAQRHALDQAERTQVDTIAQEEAKFGVFGRLKRRAKLGQGPKPGLG